MPNQALSHFRRTQLAQPGSQWQAAEVPDGHQPGSDDPDRDSRSMRVAPSEATDSAQSAESIILPPAVVVVLYQDLVLPTSGVLQLAPSWANCWGLQQGNESLPVTQRTPFRRPARSACPPVRVVGSSGSSRDLEQSVGAMHTSTVQSSC